MIVKARAGAVQQSESTKHARNGDSRREIPMKRFVRRSLSFSIGLVVSLSATRALGGHEEGDRDDRDGRRRIEIRTLSTHPDRISGGDVLVQISSPPSPRAMAISLNGRDVSGSFRPGEAPETLVGLVTGLVLGRNRLTVDARGMPGKSVVLTNYPIKGPIVSGPHVHPFICQTQTFRLPDGTFLGPPLDSDCSAATKGNYVSMHMTGGGFKPLPSTTSLPADVAMTTTSTGRAVPYVVRVETGTVNRGIYQNAVLFNPISDSPPSPFSPPQGWNKRLVAIHGAGCPGGWYTQGTAEGVNTLSDAYLSKGYALFINPLQNPSNHCNTFVAGESAMMGKEHFIKTF